MDLGQMRIAGPTALARMRKSPQQPRLIGPCGGQGEPRMQQGPGLWPLAMIALLAGTSGLWAQQALPVVSVDTVRVQSVAPNKEFVGRVEAVNTVDLRARVDGFLEARPFEEGRPVTQGQELFLIETAQYEAMLSAAQAGLAGAEATLSDAQARLDRNTQLRGNQTVSQVALDESRAARDGAQANVLAAESRVRQAQLNLDYTRITAPFAGRIGVSNFAVGSFVGPASGPLARVVQVDPIRVTFSISDRVLLDLRSESGGSPTKEEIARGLVPTLRQSNGAVFPGSGMIEFLGNEFDARTGTLPVRALFPNPDATLVPGQFVTVMVGREQAEERPVVPVGAVQMDRDGRFVLLLGAGDVVEARRIRTGAQIGQLFTVTDGLQGGETLIVQGFRAARPGAPVRPVPLPSSAAMESLPPVTVSTP